MKSIVRWLALTCICNATFVYAGPEIAARGARGGGAGGAGRAQPAARAAPARAHAVSRVPTMSRHGARPATQAPRVSHAPVSRPAVTPRAHVSNPMSAPRVSPGIQHRPAGTGQAQQRIQQFARQPRPAAHAQVDRGTIAQRRHALQPGVDRFRSTVRSNHPGYRDWFNGGFYARHNYYPYYFDSGLNWWAAPSWGVINNWVSTDWTYPVYYDVSGYQSQLVGEPVEAAPGYTVPTTGDWLPIGTFAAVRSLDQASNPTMFVQLAVSKDGDVAGSYYNSALDQVHPLEGQIVTDPQQIAWVIGDRPNSPLMTTGVYDATQDVVPVQVHYPEGTEQSWVLVRLQG